MKSARYAVTVENHLIWRRGMSSGKATFIFFLTSACAVVIAGCSGSDSSAPNPPPISSAPNVNPAQVFAGKLVKRDADTVTNFVKNGIYGRSIANAAPTLEADASTATPLANAGFSTTNTQDAGVDESDRIEFDGEIMYVADYPIWNGEEALEPQVRLLQKRQDNSLSQIASIKPALPQHRIEGMYLYDAPNNDNRLAVISATDAPVAIDILPAVSTVYAPEPYESKFSIDVVDTSTASTPRNIGSIEVEGYLISSRRIDDTLYVVSSFAPSNDDVTPYASDAETQLANYRAILSMPDEDLLPKTLFNGQEQQLLTIDDCLVPESATANDGYAQIIQVMRIDLNTPQNMQATCMSSLVSTLYASTNAIYLIGSENNLTFLHKLSLGDVVSYEASGQVEGIVGFDSAAGLRLSEKDGVLRILTTDYTKDVENPEHKLFVLQQRGNELQVLAQLPNSSQPQRIGKPGEDVYAVRYVGDRGYVVTFEQIDPLYVIDLAEPSAPAIVGELEIPGFSSYLQPFGNDLLLGIGQDTNVQNLPENGQNIDIAPVLSEMKVSLFDVRDPQNPLEISSVRRPETYTPVEWDYRALSVLKAGDKTRFGLPTERWGTDDTTNNGFYVNELLVLEVEESMTGPDMQAMFSIRPESTEQHYVFAGEDRSILTSDGVYYLRGNDVYFRTLARETILGPY